MKASFVKFGEEVEGYTIPVLNEREIRAAAGILFLLMSGALVQVLFKGNFLPIKFVITIFFTDLLIRVVINPGFSPFMIMGRFIVGRQIPEFVGAPQKKFAWTIGIVLSALMFLHLVVLNAFSVITTITCYLCLTFLFFEAAFGICLGCCVYGWFYHQKTRCCAGEICNAPNKKTKHEVLSLQFFILLSFVAYIAVLLFIFYSRFTQKPTSLF